VMSVSVCLSVCLSSRISQKPYVQTSPNFLVHAAYGLAFVLVCCVAICTVVFVDMDVVDDVMFARNEREGLLLRVTLRIAMECLGRSTIFLLNCE